MKYSNYLVRLNNGEFTLARGHQFDCGIDGLALVRVSTAPLEFTGEYFIIDIESGLFVCKDKMKKKCVEKFERRNADNAIIKAIKSARKNDSYQVRVFELNNEKQIWRQSGYEL